MRAFKRCSACGHYNLIPVMSIDPALKEKRRELTNMSNSTLSIEEKEEIQKQLDDLNTVDMIEWNKMYHRNCSYCEESLIPKFDLVGYGYQLYDEYKSFIGEEGKNLPKEIIIKEDSKLSSNGKCEFDKKLKKYVISIHPNENLHPHDLRAFLMHEFTHILDLYDPNTGMEKEDLLHWYTEYHASEIELMTYLRYKNINENKKIRLSSKIIFRNRPITLQDYLNDRVEDLALEISKYSSNTVTVDLINRLTGQIVYFRSKINYCKKHLDENSIKLLPDISKCEHLLEQYLAKDDEELSKLLMILDRIIVGTSSDISAKLFDDIIKKIRLRLVYNTPGYRHLYSIEEFTKWSESNNKEAI